MTKSTEVKYSETRYIIRRTNTLEQGKEQLKDNYEELSKDLN